MDEMSCGTILFVGFVVLALIALYMAANTLGGLDAFIASIRF